MSDQSFASMRTPNKSSIDFSVNSTCSSVKKTLFQANNERTSNYTSSSSSYGGGDFMMQAKIEHLEKERIELTMQLHKRDEKDRDRKLKLEQMEYRLKASEEERQKASQEASENREQVVRVKFEADELRAEITRLNQEIQNTNRIEAMDVWKKMTTASRALKKTEDDLNASNAAKDLLTQQYTDLVGQLDESKSMNTLLEVELSKAKANIAALLEENNQIARLEKEKEDISESFAEERIQFQNMIAALQKENDDIHLQKEKLQEELESALEQAKHAVTIVSNEDSADDVVLLRKQLFESESKRRKLHNQLQDLKGNIRVFLRCRPFLSADGDEVYQTKQTNLMLHDDKTSVTVLNPATLGTVGAKPTHQFAFDHVFTQDSKQQEVYKEVSDLVQSVLDGYRVCVFSYGQTGSGKTHTMTGNRHGEERGIIPRSVEELLRNAHTMQSQGWEVDLSVSIVEIYNEDIRDLLAKPTPNNHNNANKGEKIKIGRQNGRVVVSGLTTVPIYVGTCESSLQSYDDSSAMQQFYEVFNQSMEARSTASTGMNELSSRSHLIVMIDVNATLTTTNQGTSTMTLTGGLRLCDLAGSERLDRTNTLHDATRLRETVNINKSLSCLADVFLALSNKAPHIPYRNSKLTMLLQDCLSGDGKALMFVNVSPTIASSPETLCSLRFAAQVNSVELGKAQKHLQTTTVITQPVPVTTNNNLPPAQPQQVNATATVQNSNGATTRSRRMSVLPGMGSSSRSSTSSSAVSAVPAMPPVPPQQISSTYSLDQSVDECAPAPAVESFVANTTVSKETKSVRFDTFAIEESEPHCATSSVKPFASMTIPAAVPAATATATAGNSSATNALAASSRSRSALSSATRRTSTVPAATITANTTTAAVNVTTLSSSMVSSSLLSAAKAAKASNDTLLFSNSNASTSFVINAASLSSSSSSTNLVQPTTTITAITAARDKENIDQPQLNTLVSASTSALLSGAKRDASSALSTDFHHINGHHFATSTSAAALAMGTSTLSMPAKRLRPNVSAAHGTNDGWAPTSSLSQPAQRKTTWR